LINACRHKTGKRKAAIALVCKGQHINSWIPVARPTLNPTGPLFGSPGHPTTH
jgi:hypothetical protein